MDKLLVVGILVFGIISLVAPFFRGNQVQKYIQSKGGQHVSTDSDFFSNNKAQIVKYYDRHKNLRSVTFYDNGLFSSFGDDQIIEYSTNSPEYRKLELKARKIEKLNEQYEKVFYAINEGELAIKQEFTNPNIGEFVFLNGRIAPNGKYKLGFMNHITVEDGKVKHLTML